jgi:hypothetical protein
MYMQERLYIRVKLGAVCHFNSSTIDEENRYIHTNLPYRKHKTGGGENVYSLHNRLMIIVSSLMKSSTIP